MNPESLDSSIQGVLAALYPPFEATAPTVLSQLFRVIEGRYQGDALQCLLDFLIPAKHILESMRQSACAPYSDVVFRCEGWPLCLHERVVLQLAPVNPLLLRPGDFYLQVVPFADQAARIVLGSLLEDRREVEETPVPEASYPRMFTRDWLREVNLGRHGAPLRRCLLSTDQGIVKVPWEEVSRPEFVHRPRAMATPPSRQAEPRHATAFAVETRILPAKDGIAVSLRLVDGGRPRRAQADRPRPAGKPVGWVSPNTWDSRRTRDLEGDYVDLVEFGKEKEALALNREASRPNDPAPLRPVGPSPPAPPRESPGPCGSAAGSSGDPCSPCLRCQHRRSYLAALQNPVAFERAERMWAVPEEGRAPDQAPPTATPPPCCRHGHHRVVGDSEEVSEQAGRPQSPSPSTVSGRVDKPLVPSPSPVSEPGRPLSPSPSTVSQPARRPLSPSPSTVSEPGRPLSPSPPPSTVSEPGRPLSPSPSTAPRPGRPLSPSPSTVSEPGRPLSPSPSTVSELGRRSAAVQRPGGRSHSDVYPELIPTVQELRCKKSRAFSLASPKTDRHGRRQPAVVKASHTEVQTSSPLLNGRRIKLLSPPGEGPRGPPGDGPPSLRSWGAPPTPSQESSNHLLHLGLACLPGSRDRTGRAVVEVYGDHQGWKSPFLSSQEFCKLLLYFHSVPRKETGDLGLTVVADARKTAPPPAFFKSLWMVQELAPHAIHSVLMLVDKETSPRPERQPGLQMDVVTSLKALHKTVEGHQLTSALEGTYTYSHSDWLQLYQKLDPFVTHLREASGLLQKAIRKFEGVRKMDTVQDVQERIHEQKTMMREVLEDVQLVALQREGGAILARLRREEFRFSHSEDYRSSMDQVSSLYDQVEEQLHTLVMRSNQSLQHLDFLLKLRQLEGRFTQIREWFNAEGERRLLEAESVEDSLERVEKTLDSFSSFLAQANEWQREAVALAKEAERAQGGVACAEAEVFRTTVATFQSGLAHFLSRAQLCRAELETMATLCRFCEGATEVATDCQRYLEQSQAGDRLGVEARGVLRGYRERFGRFSEERFQEAKARAAGLKGSRGMRVWNVAWLRRQGAWQDLEDRLRETAPGPAAQPRPRVQEDGEGGPTENCEIGSQNDEKDRKGETGTEGSRMGERGMEVSGKGEKGTEGSGKGEKGTKVSGKEEKGTEGSGKGEKGTEVSGKGEATELSENELGEAHLERKEWFSWQQPFGRSLSEGSSTGSVRSEPSASPSPRGLQAAQNFQISRHGSFCSDDPGCCIVPGNDPRGAKPGVWTCPATPSHGAKEEGGSDNLRLQRIMQELLVTEREYVRSLGHVMAHYRPLLERPDVPQALRGQRGRVFGNLEKLHDFHRLVFLPELEGCRHEPLRVGRCFLRHKESFDLYALYSKNKPQSDSLLLHHGNDFFKEKQRALADQMDLSSYLLKPVQRISKYSLLLQDLLRECSGPHRGHQRAQLQAALQAVQFQLRHGNDLLAMDDIRGCDVNLKEQGQLIRQDEFMVSFRKKKCFRHVFLFQHLILFSKTKRTEVGNDVYIYKQSFKTSEVGMTHSSGDSGRGFEIWFRRRKSQDTYFLQAEQSAVKDAWTRDLERILWEQAMRSRETRMQERVFMGLGSKPFMDIQPSEAAICDRAVNCPLAGRECNAPTSSGVVTPPGDDSPPRADSIGSGSSLSTSGSQSSSSSGRGSLPPSGFPCGRPPDGGNGGCSRSGVLEHHLDQDSEKNHLLFASSESSGESVSGFSGSDGCCRSVIGGDADDTSSIVSTLRLEIGHALKAPPPDELKKPAIAPKPQTHSATRSPGQVHVVTANGKSTEV